MMLPALTLLLLAGAALALFGWRGRKVDNHPLCRHCGFDLMGSTGSTACPECGSALSVDSIALGNRVRRRWPLVAGLSLLVPCGLAMVLGIAVLALDVEIIRYQPLWMLLRANDPAAVAEIARRVKGSQFPPADCNRIVNAALDVQADTSRRWLTSWGDLVERMRGAKQVSDAQWARYARQAVAPTLRFRPVIRTSDVLPFELSHAAPRTAQSSALYVRMRIEQLSVGSVRLNASSVSGPQPLNGSFPGFSIKGAATADVDTWRSLGDGTHSARAVVCVEVGQVVWGPNPVHDFLVVGSHLVPVESPVPAAPLEPSTASAGPLDEANLRERIQSRLSVKGIGPGQEPMALIPITHDRVELLIEARHPPIALAFSVHVRDGTGRMWRMDDEVSFPAGRSSARHVSGAAGGFTGGWADVILRPGSRPAGSSPNPQPVWAGEVLLPRMVVVDGQLLVPGSQRAAPTAATRASTPRSPRRPAPGSQPARR